METPNKSYVNAPANHKSKVWKHFGLPKDQRKGVAICKLCLMDIKFSGGTTNLATHLRRHHQIDVTGMFPFPCLQNQIADALFFYINFLAD